MPEKIPPRLDLPERYLDIVKRLLQEHVPHAEVWAYGSRTTGEAHAASDLDLVLRNPDRLGEHTPALCDLREALVESNLPIRVDVMDWARIPASFHREIDCCHVVVQSGDGTAEPVSEPTASAPPRFDSVGGLEPMCFTGSLIPSPYPLPEGEGKKRRGSPEETARNDRGPRGDALRRSPSVKRRERGNVSRSGISQSSSVAGPDRVRDIIAHRPFSKPGGDCRPRKSKG